VKERLVDERRAVFTVKKSKTVSTPFTHRVGLYQDSFNRDGFSRDGFYT
jgi:hypothetical protein